MTDFLVRPSVVAGRFYEADARRLAADAAQLTQVALPENVPARLVGGVVPHAGWVCCGRLAGLAWRALAERSEARTIFLTGSVHTVDIHRPALDEADAWRTPLGDVPIDHDLREAIAALKGFARWQEAHVHEHALEVELPLMQQAFGSDVRFVPCMIPVHPDAPRWGQRLGELLGDWPEPVLVVASSDLTHYGPNYGFVPYGLGEAGRRWAHEVNDRGVLDRMVALDAAGAVEHADRHGSACGGGAIAATIAAARQLGATRGCVLAHSDSYEQLKAVGCSDEANHVGYASVVFG